jgi:hypothetical protein
MDILMGIHDFFYAKMGAALYYALVFIGVIALLAQWRLYEKAGQPGIAALVPVWNVIVFLKIVGRPASHGWLFLVPVYGQLYFMPKVWIEVVQSFGKRSMMDYVMVIAFNGIYILNLAMDDDTIYQGGVYGEPPTLEAPHSLKKPSPSLAA